MGNIYSLEVKNIRTNALKEQQRKENFERSVSTQKPQPQIPKKNFMPSVLPKTSQPQSAQSIVINKDQEQEVFRVTLSNRIKTPEIKAECMNEILKRKMRKVKLHLAICNAVIFK